MMTIEIADANRTNLTLTYEILHYLPRILDAILHRPMDQQEIKIFCIEFSQTFLNGMSDRFPTLAHYVGCNLRSKENLTTRYKTVIYPLSDLKLILIELSGVDMTESCLKGKTNIVYCSFTTQSPSSDSYLWYLNSIV